MKPSRLLTATLCLASLLSVKDDAFAAGGTSIVAAKGQPTHVAPGWPEGVGELVNDASRTSGWNSWFSEWPNDVNQYAFEIESIDDLNRLIDKLAAIKSDLRHIRFSHLKEPNGLGWVTRVPEGNGIPVIFSIGNQARIDEWFKRVRKPFGVMEFTATPVAVPPTRTIFVQNVLVNLDKLKSPNDIGFCLLEYCADAGTGDKDAGTGDKDAGTGDKDAGTGDKDAGTGDKAVTRG